MSLTLEENEYEYRRVSEGEQGILQKNAMYSKWFTMKWSFENWKYLVVVANFFFFILQ